MENIERELERIMRHAGRMVLDGHAATVSVKEGHANFVTNCDVAVQEYILSELRRLMPQAKFIAEESDTLTLCDEPTFCVDPIDGTLNFIHGRGASCVSVALLEHRAPTVGAIYNPFADEFFYAARGEGTTRNGQPVHVSDFPMNEAMIAFGTSPYNPELSRKTLHILRRFMQEAADLRRVGAATVDLCDVACGRSDAYFELELGPWDHAAGELIAREAGAICINPFGEIRFDGKCAIFAATPRVCERALALFYEGWREEETAT